MHVHHSRWDTLSPARVTELLEQHLPGVTVLPYRLADQLKKLKTATIEVLENRTLSTGYRIKQTGQVFTLPEVVLDDLINRYEAKPLVFIISEESGANYAERLKPPRCKAIYDPATKNILQLDWLDDASEVSKISNIKKLEYFLRSLGN